MTTTPPAMAPPRVAVIMGSDSDWPIMRAAVDVLDEFAVPSLAQVVSAHRTPHDMLHFADEAVAAGLAVIIAGAGGAADLPGMVAAATPLPVIGVPIPNGAINGIDALLSIAQMPGGVPVATMAIGGAKNAGLLAVRILATADGELAEKMRTYQVDLAAASRAKTIDRSC